MSAFPVDPRAPTPGPRSVNQMRTREHLEAMAADVGVRLTSHYRLELLAHSLELFRRTERRPWRWLAGLVQRRVVARLQEPRPR